MPLIELLRPEQRAWLRRLCGRIANRELMRRTRTDIDVPFVRAPTPGGAPRRRPDVNGWASRAQRARGSLSPPAGRAAGIPRGVLSMSSARTTVSLCGAYPTLPRDRVA